MAWLTCYLRSAYMRSPELAKLEEVAIKVRHQLPRLSRLLIPVSVMAGLPR